MAESYLCSQRQLWELLLNPVLVTKDSSVCGGRVCKGDQKAPTPWCDTEGIGPLKKLEWASHRKQLGWWFTNMLHPLHSVPGKDHKCWAQRSIRLLTTLVLGKGPVHNVALGFSLVVNLTLGWTGCTFVHNSWPWHCRPRRRCWTQTGKAVAWWVMNGWFPSIRSRLERKADMTGHKRSSSHSVGGPFKKFFPLPGIIWLQDITATGVTCALSFLGVQRHHITGKEKMGGWYKARRTWNGRLGYLGCSYSEPGHVSHKAESQGLFLCIVLTPEYTLLLAFDSRY